MDSTSADIGQAIEKLGFKDVPLLDRERIDLALNVGNASAGWANGSPEAILLTDQRVIHLDANGRTLRAVYVSLWDVDSVEVARDRSGYAGYVWGGLSLVVGLMVWRIWDEPVWSLVAGVAVALIGMYLLLDHMLTPGKVKVTVRAGATDFQCGVATDASSDDAREFVSRLFQLKNGSVQQGAAAADRFAPR